MGCNWISWKVLVAFIASCSIGYSDLSEIMFLWGRIDTPFFFLPHGNTCLFTLCRGSRFWPAGRFAKRERVFEEGHVFYSVVLRELRSFVYAYVKWWAKEPLKVSQPDHSLASLCTPLLQSESHDWNGGVKEEHVQTLSSLEYLVMCKATYHIPWHSHERYCRMTCMICVITFPAQ